MNTIYEIEITTSNLRNAGTDCDVYIQIYGHKIRTGIQNNSSILYPNFFYVKYLLLTSIR